MGSTGWVGAVGVAPSSALAPDELAAAAPPDAGAEWLPVRGEAGSGGAAWLALHNGSKKGVGLTGSGTHLAWHPDAPATLVVAAAHAHSHLRAFDATTGQLVAEAPLHESGGRWAVDGLCVWATGPAEAEAEVEVAVAVRLERDPDAPDTSTTFKAGHGEVRLLRLPLAAAAAAAEGPPAPLVFAPQEVLRDDQGTTPRRIQESFTPPALPAPTAADGAAWREVCYCAFGRVWVCEPPLPTPLPQTPGPPGKDRPGRRRPRHRRDAPLCFKVQWPQAAAAAGPALADATDGATATNEFFFAAPFLPACADVRGRADAASPTAGAVTVAMSPNHVVLVVGASAFVFDLEQRAWR